MNEKTPVTESEPEDWRAWRKAQRRELIERRRALETDDLKQRSNAVDRWLAEGFGPVAGRTVGFCWPFAAEPDPRFAIRRWREGGSRAALPVVMAPRTPLEFREWWPGAPMERGVYDIPYPVDTPVCVPEVALVPVNGFDRNGYRLGYGGGYFDRTLASYDQRPMCIGLGFEIARMDTIFPRDHDIPFDFMVTDAGIYQRVDGWLLAVDASDTHAAVSQRLR